MKFCKSIFSSIILSTIIFSAMAMEQPKQPEDNNEIKSLTSDIKSLKLGNPYTSFELFTNLPKDLQQQIASNLSPKDLYTLSKVSGSTRRMLLKPSMFPELKELNENIKKIVAHIIEDLFDNNFIDEQNLSQLSQAIQKINPIIPLEQRVINAILSGNLDLSNSSMTSDILDVIIKNLVLSNLHENIQTICLKNNRLTSLPKSLCKFTQLRELDLRDNPPLSLKTLWEIQNALQNTTIISSISMCLD